MKLNKAQREAIYHGDGPARVLAGPGSGKTFVIVQRLKYLVEELHVEPSAILVITFTKAAAEEMQERFYRLMGNTNCPVYFGTFHAVFYYILKQSNSSFSKHILSLSDKSNLIQKIKKSFITKFPQASFPIEDELIKQIGKFKNLGEDFNIFKPEKELFIDRQTFLWIYNTYNSMVKSEQKTDFDDMAGQCFELLHSNPAISEMWRETFKYILIDEFQDINAPQYEVVKYLAGARKNLFVVGDDDQAIYGFRGANPGIMKTFLKDYPESKCIFLNINYRSEKEIVEASGKCISKNMDRIDKEFISQTVYEKMQIDLNVKEDNGLKADSSVNVKAFPNKKDEQDYIIKCIRKWADKNEGYEDSAIICRTNFELEDYALLLKSEKIPYQRREKRKSIFEHFIMKDLEAYLRIALGEMSRKLLLQIINRPKRFIGRECFGREKMGLSELLEACRCSSDKYIRIEKLQADCLKISKMRPFLAVNYIRKGIGYDDYLKENAGNNRELLKELMEYADFFQNHSKEYSSIKDWVRAIELYREECVKDDGNKKKHGVHLVTMHGAKGLEFPMVIIPDANEGVMPRGKIVSKSEEEEERRIFYVAMTRAKSKLEICYINGDSERKRLPSRFIQPLLEKQS